MMNGSQESLPNSKLSREPSNLMWICAKNTSVNILSPTWCKYFEKTEEKVMKKIAKSWENS
jgi:hypothetical protein